MAVTAAPLLFVTHARPRPKAKPPGRNPSRILPRMPSVLRVDLPQALQLVVEDPDRAAAGHDREGAEAGRGNTVHDRALPVHVDEPAIADGPGGALTDSDRAICPCSEAFEYPMFRVDPGQGASSFATKTTAVPTAIEFGPVPSPFR